MISHITNPKNGDDSDGQNLNFDSPVNFLKELLAGL